MGAGARMFVAVVPPLPALEHLEEFLGPRRETAAFRWTVPEQWHLTLAFSAHVPDRAYDDLVDRLARAAAKRAPVATRLSGGGAFPNPARARVLFAGLELPPAADTPTGPGGPADPADPDGPADPADPDDPAPDAARVPAGEELRRMAVGARAALAKAGAEVDGQRFRPHLTLARTGRPVEATRWVRLLDTYTGPAWQVEELVLIASHLGEGPRKRPRHEVAETFSLGRAGSGREPPGAPPRGR